jgi:ubiquinone/menaquinone biosynthesis C-methylase UbiE
MKTTIELRRDFDRIARASEEARSSLDAYERFLLQHAPPQMQEALEVGCGTGAFTRALAQRAARVVAIDLSPAMIDLARRRSTDLSNIDYVVADATSMALPERTFDCVASIATLHHLELGAMLARLAAALRPGGMLLVLDLVDPMVLAELPMNALAWIATRLRRRRPSSVELQHAWKAHGSGEVYPRYPDVRRLAAKLLPGARLRRHLFWRYSLVWRRPHPGQRPVP